ncbi:MAG: hypothetical protein RSC20_05230, partial [Clostridiales bacterium]
SEIIALYDDVNKKLNIKVGNAGLPVKKFCVFTALYNETALMNTQKTDIIKLNENCEYINSVNMELPMLKDNIEIKVFAWENLDNITPVYKEFSMKFNNKR